jgi:hypothetical protein
MNDRAAVGLLTHQLRDCLASGEGLQGATMAIPVAVEKDRSRKTGGVVVILSGGVSVRSEKSP